MIDTLLKDREELLVNGKLHHLSHSRVSKYLTCPEQYRLYYVENVRARVPGAALVFGQVIHQSLAELFLKKGDPIKHFQDTWNMLKAVKLDYSERESWEKLKAGGEGLIGKFVKDELPKLSRVTGIEKVFDLSITSLDQPFIGVIDLVAELNGTGTVVDFKTAGSAYDDHEADMSDQLTAYKLAEPGAEQLALCVLVKTKEPKIEWHVTSRTGDQLVEYLSKVGYVAQEITAGHFYKRPGKWCSWCDYLPVCLGNKRRAEETLVRVE